MKEKILCLMLTASVLLSGCSNQKSKFIDANRSSLHQTSESAAIIRDNKSSESISNPASEESDTSSVPASEEADTSSIPASEKFEFNPHLYLPMLDAEIPQDYWDSFHNLCDALRAGKTTFHCSSEEAYRWVTDPSTLTELFPTG